MSNYITLVGTQCLPLGHLRRFTAEDGGHRKSLTTHSRLDFESIYVDLEIKSRHKTDSFIGHWKRGMALKQRCASAVK